MPAPDGPLPPPPPLSPRVALEVSLLASSTDPATDGSADVSTPPTPADPRIVLVAARDPDLRRYVRECLAGRPDLVVVEVAALPRLLIVDGLDGAGVPPRLLLADGLDAPDDAPDRPAPGEVLAAPFNARQLLQAVERALGSTR